MAVNRGRGGDSQQGKRGWQSTGEEGVAVNRGSREANIDVVLLVSQHPFMKHKKAMDKTAICDLIMESKAEVVEMVEDLTEEEDIKELKVRSHTQPWQLLLASERLGISDVSPLSGISGLSV